MIPFRKIILQSERCRFFCFAKEDAPFFFAMNNEPEVLQYTGDLPFESLSDTEKFIANYDHYQKYGFGRWSVYRKKDNQYLGFCGLKYDAVKDEIDLGFRFRKAVWGYGYATETASAVVQLALTELNIKTLVGRAMAANTASIRVLEKIGMQESFRFIENNEQWLQMELQAY